MKKSKFFFVLASLILGSLNTVQAQWNENSITNSIFPTTLSRNVGIGIAIPQSRLDVNGDVHIPSGSSYWIGGIGDTGGNRLRLHHNGLNAYIDYMPNLYFRSNGTTILTMDVNGNVVIGTPTPTPESKFEVNSLGNKIQLLRNGASAITFYPKNNDAIYHIAHTLNNTLQISNGPNPGDTPMATFFYNGELRLGNAAQVRLLTNGSASIAFFPNNGNSCFYISHNLNNALQISQGSNPGDYPLMTIKNTGNIGIGTTHPDYSLDVIGTIRAHEVLVNMTGTADFVFKDNYKLKPIQEVYKFAKENKHLPEIPSEAEVVKNGMNMGEFQVKLLQKVEELTVYVAQQDQIAKDQAKKIQEQQTRIQELEDRLKK